MTLLWFGCHVAMHGMLKEEWVGRASYETPQLDVPLLYIPRSSALVGVNCMFFRFLKVNNTQ